MKQQYRQKTPHKKIILSRKEIIDLLIREKKPLSLKEIIKILDYTADTDKSDGILRRLNAMSRDGQILKNRKNQYGISARMNLVTGIVEGHPEGYGFLIPEGGGDDLYLHPAQMRRLMHGDKIIAHVARIDRRGRKEAKVVDVLERANKQLVARYFVEQGVGVALPVNARIKHEIIIPSGAEKNAQNDQMVLLEITRQPDKRLAPIGQIVEVLGDHMAPGMEIDVALHTWAIPHVWPEEVSAQATATTAVVPEQDYKDRIDLSHLPLVTIDGEDAQDFDDAVWCKRTPKGWKAIVAIADVSHYVQPDDTIDNEAKLRGTSVYFPDFVVPMLPEALSNGICSLNPDEPRLSMVCEMIMDKAGKVNRSRFFQAIIHSHARLTYNQVGTLFAGGQKKLGKKLPVLWDLYDLYKVLRKQRDSRGVINFSTVETKISFGDGRKIDKIIPVERNDAHKLIEELMINANVCAGKFLQKHKIHGLFRVHEKPAADKVTDVRSFLNEFNLKLKGGDTPAPEDYAKVLSAAQKRPEFNLIQTVLLRSLRQAHYTPENDGHFGLAREVYAHFTSPIRRYPDLLVHRAIRFILNGGKPKDYFYSIAEMQQLGDHCSMTERRADDATRDVTGWLKCEYMQDKLGEVFTGIISSVTGFGLFIEIDDIYVDGLLHISVLPSDYYNFDPVRHQLAGENSGRKYRLGDAIKVKLARVDLDERKIDFVLPKS